MLVSKTNLAMTKTIVVGIAKSNTVPIVKDKNAINRNLPFRLIILSSALIEATENEMPTYKKNNKLTMKYIWLGIDQFNMKGEVSEASAIIEILINRNVKKYTS